MNQAIYGFNSWVYQVTIATFLYKQTHSTLAVSTQLTCTLISAMLSSNILNNITPSQKYKLIEYTQTFALLSAICVGGLAITHQLQPMHLYLVALLNGFFHTGYTGVRNAILMDFKQDKKVLSSLNSKISSLNKMIAPMLAGLILYAFDTTLGFMLNIALLLINRIVLSVELKKLGKLMIEPFQTHQIWKINVLIETLMKKDSIKKYYLLVGILFSGYVTMLPKIIYHTLHLNEMYFSLTYLITGFAGICNSMLFPQVKNVRLYLKFNIVLQFFSILGLILNAYLQQVALTFMCLYLMGFGIAAVINSMDYLNHEADEENFLKRMSAFSLIFIIGNMISYQIYTAIANIF